MKIWRFLMISWKSSFGLSMIIVETEELPVVLLMILSWSVKGLCFVSTREETATRISSESQNFGTPRIAILGKGVIPVVTEMFWSANFSWRIFSRAEHWSSEARWTIRRSLLLELIPLILIPSDFWLACSWRIFRMDYPFEMFGEFDFKITCGLGFAMFLVVLRGSIGERMFIGTLLIVVLALKLLFASLEKSFWLKLAS